MPEAASVLALMRHGQSRWNEENRFTGWWDSDLTAAGEEEARSAGRLLRDCGVEFSACWTSLQTRAIRTLWLALREMDRVWLPSTADCRLNERHYGGLTGLDKSDIARRHGAEQVHVWRRSFDVPPPPMTPGSPYSVQGDRRYRNIDVPLAESLRMTLERVEPVWRECLVPGLASQGTLLVSAHGNSLRALVKLIFAVSNDDIAGIEIPTGVPLLVELDADSRPLSVRYLDPDRGTPPPLPA